MERNYSYLKKHRFLLPVAYLSRIGKIPEGDETEQKGNYAKAKVIEIGSRRVDC